MVYKSKKKQRIYQRQYKWAQRHGQKFKNPWQGLEKLGTERVKRKSRMLPLAAKNGRKRGTWLHKPPRHAAAAKKRSSRIRGNF